MIADLEIPTHVAVLIEYRKGDRRARSLCYVLSDSEGLVFAAGTMDGRQPMGLVTIDKTSIVRVVRLVEGQGVGG